MALVLKQLRQKPAVENCCLIGVLFLINKPRTRVALGGGHNNAIWWFSFSHSAAVAARCLIYIILRHLFRLFLFLIVYVGPLTLLLPLPILLLLLLLFFLLFPLFLFSFVPFYCSSSVVSLCLYLFRIVSQPLRHLLLCFMVYLSSLSLLKNSLLFYPSGGLTSFLSRILLFPSFTVGFTPVFLLHIFLFLHHLVFLIIRHLSSLGVLPLLAFHLTK